MNILKYLIIIIITLVVFTENSIAQLCSISQSPRIYAQKIPPKKFLETNSDFEVLKERPPYTRLIVRPEKLHIRDSPNGSITGTAFQGQRLVITGKKGKWVAITYDVREVLPNSKTSWVHLDYLTVSKIEPLQVKVLLEACSVEEMAGFLSNNYKSKECASVKKYIRGKDRSEASNRYKGGLLKWLKFTENEALLDKVNRNCF